MTLPYTQDLKDKLAGNIEEPDPTPKKSEFQDELRNAGVDEGSAERLAAMIEDGLKMSRNTGYQEADLGDEEEQDDALLYAVIASTVLSAVNAFMLYHVHFKGVLF